MTQSPLKLAIVAGEESGDLLGADLVNSIRKRLAGRTVQLVGVGGDHLSALGLKSMINQHDIALVGLSAVLVKLPQLIYKISKVANAIIAAKPDCLIIIDSPDFTHRVAKKVRAADPSIPIVNYISPSVWAWRPQRARIMRSYIDHVLTILPFEVQALRDLDGPDATYVGHRLVSHPPLIAARQTQLERAAFHDRAGPDNTILILPGSRRSEIRSLMGPFGLAVQELKERNPDLSFVLPTLPSVEGLVREEMQSWPVQIDVVIGEDAKYRAFSVARAALAASGTVSFELALARVPTVLAYKADWFAKVFIAPRIRIWSAALPNIITDSALVPETFNESIRPGLLARQIEGLVPNGPKRQAQLNGFDRLAEIMATERPSGEIAAEKIIELT
ncbi:MAG: lipid-A-disaccharide synthase [Phyllobacterium sp.]